MADGAGDRRMACLMTIDARFHLHLEDREDGVLRPDIAVTGSTGDAFGGVLAGTEHDEVGVLVYRCLRHDHFVLGDGAVTGQTGFAGREAGTRPGQGGLVAAGARELRSLMR